jgi:hypothetical protein
MFSVEQKRKGREVTNGLRNFSCIGPSLTVEVSEKGVTESVKFG